MWTPFWKEGGWLCRHVHARVCRLAIFPAQMQAVLILESHRSSHLLLHDDSISTRVVSYILYLPNSPASEPAESLQPSADGTFLKGWRPEWGGALELFPVEGGATVGPPVAKRSTKVDVTWGNLIFFQVQPGRSYHAVEEVVVGAGRQRLGISGW